MFISGLDLKKTPFENSPVSMLSVIHKFQLSQRIKLKKTISLLTESLILKLPNNTSIKQSLSQSLIKILKGLMAQFFVMGKHLLGKLIHALDPILKIKKRWVFSQELLEKCSVE